MGDIGLVLTEDRVKKIYTNKIIGQQEVNKEDLIPIIKYRLYEEIGDTLVENAHKKLSLIITRLRVTMFWSTKTIKESKEYKQIMRQTTKKQREDFFLYYVKVNTSQDKYIRSLESRECLESNIVVKAYKMRAWFNEGKEFEDIENETIEQEVLNIVGEYVGNTNTRLEEDGRGTRVSRQEVLDELIRYKY